MCPTWCCVLCCSLLLCVTVNWEAEASSHLSMGTLREMRREPELAIESFRTALRLSRDHTHGSQYEISALASLGRCHLVAEQYEDALLQLRAARQLTLDQKSPSTSMMAKTTAFLGRALHASGGDLDEARQSLEVSVVDARVCVDVRVCGYIYIYLCVCMCVARWGWSLDCSSQCFPVLPSAHPHACTHTCRWFANHSRTYRKRSASAPSWKMRT
jgi:hypothetical protein